MHTEIKTIEDAKTAYVNSGVLGWKWFDGFEESKLIEWIFRNCSSSDELEAAIKSFLVANGQNPKEYDL